MISPWSQLYSFGVGFLTLILVGSILLIVGLVLWFRFKRGFD
jgi:hypothetical protein